MSDVELMESVIAYGLSIVKSADEKKWYVITPFNLEASKKGVKQVRYTSPHEDLRTAITNAIQAIEAK